MIHSGTATAPATNHTPALSLSVSLCLSLSLSLSHTMALSSSTEDRSPHYPRTSHVPTAHLWGSGSAGRTSDLHPQSPNILQFRIFLPSAFLPRSLPPPTSIHVIPSPRILIGGSLHRRPRPRPRPPTFLRRGTLDTHGPHLYK